METGTLEKKIAKLPENLKQRVEGYVDALLIESFEKLSPGAQSQVVKNIEELLNNENENSTALTSKPRAQFGDLKGFVKYIADDFDAPLEEFKDYM